MYVNGLTFLTTVSKRILYRTAFYITSQEIPDILTGLDQVIQLYKKADFKITTLYGNKEFKSLKILSMMNTRQLLTVAVSKNIFQKPRITIKLLRSKHMLPPMQHHFKPSRD